MKTELQTLTENLYLEFTETYYRLEPTTTPEDSIFHSKIKKKFHMILQNFLFDEELSTQNIENLVQLHISANIPFIVFINELNFIEDGITHIFLNTGKYDEIKKIYTKCSLLKERASSAYLKSYLDTLKSKNTIRLIRLSEIMQKHVLNFYEDHILWLNCVSDAVSQNSPELLPEADSKLCSFGKWLNSEGKEIISNNSKYIALIELHNTLHSYLHKVKVLLPSRIDKFLVSLTFLEKMEMLSLEIGTELALIDNKIMISEAAKDPLTGVLNRSLLDQIFLNQFEISQATERSFILAMCDLDHFKSINDTYGHLAGDQLLKKFAAIAEDELRSSDIIIRYGGEEFVIILPSVSYENGYKILDALRLLFQNSSVTFDASTISATISIGMTLIPASVSDIDHSESLNRYLKLADSKLYEAKRNGRNRVL